jgi:hypothetical protein
MKSPCIALSKDRVMPPQKTRPMEFERAIGAFRVQPDWYEEYWLRPNKATPRGAERRWRWNLLSIPFCPQPWRQRWSLSFLNEIQGCWHGGIRKADCVAQHRLVDS